MTECNDRGYDGDIDQNERKPRRNKVNIGISNNANGREIISDTDINEDSFERAGSRGDNVGQGHSGNYKSNYGYNRSKS